jgi:hypothetical protein
MYQLAQSCRVMPEMPGSTPAVCLRRLAGARIRHIEHIEPAPAGIR